MKIECSEGNWMTASSLSLRIVTTTREDSAGEILG
uniref:Uncharacterized protein n=2 Tax=Anguilla anguilla TaxID=7936 RepID=A0A0E9V863_ANGAN